MKGLTRLQHGRVSDSASHTTTFAAKLGRQTPDAAPSITPRLKQTGNGRAQHQADSSGCHAAHHCRTPHFHTAKIAIRRPGFSSWPLAHGACAFNRISASICRVRGVLGMSLHESHKIPKSGIKNNTPLLQPSSSACAVCVRPSFFSAWERRAGPVSHVTRAAASSASAAAACSAAAAPLCSTFSLPLFGCFAL